MDYIVEDEKKEDDKPKAHKKKQCKVEKRANIEEMKENARLLNINRRFNNIYSSKFMHFAK